MPPKKKEAVELQDLPIENQPSDIWAVDVAEPRSSFVKRVSLDLLRIGAGDQKGYAKNDLANQCYARACELADLLGLK